MINVLFVTPISGNGGIQSWSRKMLSFFPNGDIKLRHINVSYRRSVLKHEIGIKRPIDGLIDLFNVYFDVLRAIKKEKPTLLHTTTSGNIGCLRDLIIGRLVKRNNIPAILHCHYGCLSNDYVRKGIVGFLLRHSLPYYDQIWVLDKKTYGYLNAIDKFKGKVYITPNFIDVPFDNQIVPKEYKRIAFVGNLVKTKGLFEVIKAVKDSHCNIVLDIVGPGREKVLSEMMALIGDELNKKIIVHGCMDNKATVDFMKNVDIIALPSYYKSEAFPISILEAMSLGKLVVSTRRAAIPDMLTDLDGNDCGYFVREQNSDDIIEAIKWCQTNKHAADIRCKKAYEKVKSCYDMHVVMDVYKSLYYKLAK